METLRNLLQQGNTKLGEGIYTFSLPTFAAYCLLCHTCYHWSRGEEKHTGGGISAAAHALIVAVGVSAPAWISESSAPWGKRGRPVG
jgi:hypothetical protein